MERIRKKCDPGTNYRKPNFIALDFIGENSYKDIVEPFNSFFISLV
jgi:hypothetical protein